ncbi:hypothetical protein N2152v2_007719 [Parachlorella kessleri]
MTHYDTWQQEFPGQGISIKVPEREGAGSAWVGMYRGAGGGGIVEMSPRKTDLHLADRGMDMDLITGHRRGPGTAGAHPVCKGEGEHSASFLRDPKALLSRAGSGKTPHGPQAPTEFHMAK